MNNLKIINQIVDDFTTLTSLIYVIKGVSISQYYSNILHGSAYTGLNSLFIYNNHNNTLYVNNPLLSLDIQLAIHYDSEKVIDNIQHFLEAEYNLISGDYRIMYNFTTILSDDKIDIASKKLINPKKFINKWKIR